MRLKTAIMVISTHATLRTWLESWIVRAAAACRSSQGIVRAAWGSLHPIRVSRGAFRR